MGPSGELLETKAAVSAVGVGNWISNMIFQGEAWPGSWQAGIQTESTPNILRFSAVYACIALIASDVSKLCMRLMELQGDIWREVDGKRDSPFLPLLRKPNHYQTAVQFLQLWMTTKLMYGNAYIFKEKDRRGVVSALYVLDPRMVTTYVAPDGEVFYQLQDDDLNQVTGKNTVPESEIIHDRMTTLFHPLCGVSPLYACAYSSTQGVRIQSNSEQFFKNMSRPSGMLTAPAAIDETTAERLKREFQMGFSGTNIGKLFVAGSGLKYEPMTIPAQEAQLIEQLGWTVEDVARAFSVPLYKISAGAYPQMSNIGALKQDYLDTCLQVHITGIEALLNDGLGLTRLGMKVDLDEDDLLRMDPLSRAEIADKKVKSGTMKPNEARAADDLPPVAGGDQCYLQQQNFSLAALAKRDAKEDPFSTSKPEPAKPAAPAAPTTEPEDDEEDTIEASAAALHFKARCDARAHAWSPQVR